jgi:hypothetical protein
MTSETVEVGTVQVGEESVGYEIRIIDARSPAHKDQDAARGRPGGNILVVVPGHGQTVHGPKKLAVAAARMSKARLAWCIDPVPAAGGDRIEAQAIAAIARERIEYEFPAAKQPTMATVIGWSHGGSEGLRAADCDSSLFRQFLGLCSTGIVERRPLELLWSFVLEALRIVWASLRRLDWACLFDTIRLGLDAAYGMLRDLWRTRSLRRVIDDIGWAAIKVPGPEFIFDGEVVLLFGAQDTVVRWRDAFPGCEQPEDIPTHLPAFTAENFPRASLVEVQAIEGSHVSPEADATRFLGAGLSLLDQLADSAPLEISGSGM